MGRRGAWVRGIGVTLSLLPLTVGPPVAAQTATAPAYNARGELILPEGFEEWVFVGADLGVAYKPEAFANTAVEAARSASKEVFHNIYINREAYEYFRANNEFPDPTILVMEEFEANDKDPGGVLERGMFEDARVGLEAAVKNSKRPDGSSTPWAYYVFMSAFDPAHQLVTETAAKPDAACFRCHEKNAQQDNVWVQFYPTLRKLLE